MLRRTFVLSLALLICLVTYSRNVSPFDYGLREAKNGEDRFWALYNAHADALKKNVQVDYSGIKQLDIEIPAKAKSIVLEDGTDFKGVIFNVHNTKKAYFYLFTMKKKAEPVNVSKKHVCSYSFIDYPELRNGVKLLIVEDNTPWVEERIGFKYGHKRRDILLLKNGKALNATISPYNNDISTPICSFYEDSDSKKYIKNLTFNRTANSTEKSLLIKIQGYNNVEISGLNIYTSNPNNWNDDYAVNISDCTNLTIKNVVVEGTYSLKDKFGYAICLNNVYNVIVKKMYGDAPWGVFDCNNINKATILKSNLNRFDLHCYGRDYTYKKCTIRQSAPLSSMFGRVVFKDCVFEHAYPCLFRTDYNAYTPLDLEYVRCKFIVDKAHNSIVYLSTFYKESVNREELRKKCMPNIKIKKCELWLEDGVRSWDLIHMYKNEYPEKIGHMSSIIINGLVIYGAEAEISIASKFKQELITENAVNIDLSNIRYNNGFEPKFNLNLNRGINQQLILQTKYVSCSFVK